MRPELGAETTPTAPAEAGNDVAQHPVIEPGFDPAGDLIQCAADIHRLGGLAGIDLVYIKCASLLVRCIKAAIEFGNVITRLGIAIDEQARERGWEHAFSVAQSGSLMPS